MDMEQIGSLLGAAGAEQGSEDSLTIWKGTERSQNAQKQLTPERRARVVGIYAELRPYLSQALKQFNLSEQHIVAVAVSDGIAIRYNIADSIFAKSASEEAPGTSLIFKITALKNSERIEIPQNRLKYYNSDKLPLVATEQKRPLARKIDYAEDILPALADAICRDIYDYLIGYPSDFGCCSRNVECSKVGRCVHPDQDMAMCCYYHKNLVRGNVLY